MIFIFFCEGHVHQAAEFLPRGAIGYSWSQLGFLQSTMNAQRYVDDVILPYHQQVEEEVFQQDNTRFHVPRTSLNRVEEAHACTLVWSPRFPAFSPIKYVYFFNANYGKKIGKKGSKPFGIN